MGAGGSLQGGADWGAGKGGQKRVLDFGCCSLFSTIFQVTSQASFTAYAAPPAKFFLVDRHRRVVNTHVTSRFAFELRGRNIYTQ